MDLFGSFQPKNGQVEMFNFEDYELGTQVTELTSPMTVREF